MAADDSFTKLLLQMEGANGGTTFTDSVGVNTVTAHGAAVTSTAKFKFGSTSALLSAIGDYLSVPDSADWNFGSGDFTIDFFVNHSSLSGTNVRFPYIWQDQGSGIWMLNSTTISGNFIQFFYVDTGGVTRANYTATHGMSLNTWYHIALQRRSGTNIDMFKDGVPYSITVGTAIGATAMPDLTGLLRIGGQDWAMSGNIDGLRVSKGVARYAAGGFTPPAIPYGPSLVSAVGSFALTGKAAAFPITRKVSAGVGQFMLNGMVANRLRTIRMPLWTPGPAPRLVKRRVLPPSLEV